MAHASEKKFPVSSKDYKLYEEVGEGVSATVYRALCIPLDEIVAIKVLDLEKCNNDLVCRLFFFKIFPNRFEIFEFRVFGQYPYLPHSVRLRACV